MRASTEEHAHVADFCLGDTAQRPLYGGPFLLDTDEVAFRMCLRLTYQKLTVAKTDFHLDRSLTSELLHPINGTQPHAARGSNGCSER